MVKLFSFDLGDEFRSLPEPTRKQLCLEWERKRTASGAPKAYLKLALLFWYLAFPAGLFMIFTAKHHPSQLPLGIICVTIPVLWLIFHGIIQILAVKKFMKTRAKQLVSDESTSTGEITE